MYLPERRSANTYASQNETFSSARACNTTSATYSVNMTADTAKVSAFLLASLRVIGLVMLRISMMIFPVIFSRREQTV